MPSSTKNPVTRRVDAWTLRCLFNRLRLWERAVAGELDIEPDRDGSPHSESGQPGGTRSRQAYYYQGSVEVARVHMYVLPNGTLGGGGRPDPKMVCVDGIRYQLHRGPDEAMRSPELRFENELTRRIYKAWRRIKCWMTGT